MLTLDQLLAGLEVEAVPFALCEVRGRGCLDLGRTPAASLHYTLAGRGRLRPDGGPGIDLAPHTVVIVPAGLGQRLEAVRPFVGSAGELPQCAPLEEGWQRHAAGAGRSGVLLACGHLVTTFRGAQGLFAHLDEPLVAALAPSDPLRTTLASLFQELAAGAPGTRTFARALMEQALVLLLRRLCPDGRCTRPWLLALEDFRLARALAAMTAAPAAAHTVEELAGRAGMSRSAFARHFAEAFGRGPMDFLREIRLNRAAELLCGSKLPIKALAGEVGFTSRSYFSRAFKARYGLSPAEYRARNTAAPHPGHGRGEARRP